MSSSPFTPFTAKNLARDGPGIQEVIFYCASRLLAAATVTVNAAPTAAAEGQAEADMLQRALLAELGFTLNYIGMCTAVGHSIEIPIIIRQLAANLYQNANHGHPISFDRDFIVSLDAGSGPDDLAAATTSYHNQWWTGPMPPPRESLLTISTLHACLEHHRRVTGIKGIHSTPLLKKSYSWPAHIKLADGQITANCESCRWYRGVALSVQESYRDLEHQAEALSCAQEANADSFERRAAIAFQLYEAAAAKDAIPPPPLQTMTAKAPPNSTSATRRSKTVQFAAAAELRRLQNLPHVKWTSGEALTRDEVLSAVTLPPKSSRIHTGYRISLPDGRLPPGSSGTGSVGSIEMFSDIGEDNMTVPELDSEQYPHHFGFPPLRHDYNPPPLNRPAVGTDQPHPSYVPTVPPASNPGHSHDDMSAHASLEADPASAPSLPAAPHSPAAIITSHPAHPNSPSGALSPLAGQSPQQHAEHPHSGAPECSLLDSDSAFGRPGGALSDSDSAFGRPGGALSDSDPEPGSPGDPSDQQAGLPGEPLPDSDLAFGHPGGALSDLTPDRGHLGDASLHSDSAFGRPGGALSDSNSDFGRPGGDLSDSDSAFGHPGGALSDSDSAFGHPGGALSDSDSDSAFGRPDDADDEHEAGDEDDDADDAVGTNQHHPQHALSSAQFLPPAPESNSYSQSNFHTLAAASRPTSSIPGPFTAASFGPVLEQDLHPSSPGSSDVATYQPGR